MVIKRIYNNNVAMVEDEGVERIAIGRGITFGRSRGDELDTSAVEKVFTLDDPDSLNRLERLIKGIPSEYLSVAEDIVAMLRAELGSDVDDNVLIALTDHISMAIERERAEVPCDNPLLMETRRFYKKEFALALRAQDIIEDRLGIRVSEGEVGFITLHIVNATMRQRADHLMLFISMINEILGILLTNQTIVAAVPFLQLPVFAVSGKVIYNSLMFIVNNLAVLFCAGIAGAMAKKDKGHATLIGLMSFFLFLNANNIVLEAMGMLAEPTQLGLVGTGQSSVLGIQVLDMGVFGGIVLGCLAGWVFNKFGGKQFPVALSMFSGVRFPFLIMIVISLVLGAGACVVWPPVQGAIASLAGMIQESGSIGLFVYGMLNKLLVPLGLHHLIYTPFQFSDVGGTLALGETVIAGAYPIRVAEMAMEGVPFSPSTYFNSYTFNNLWPYLGIGAAFIVTAYKQNKDKTRAVIIPLMITAVLTCITEPIDFLFVFSAPVLFVVHSILSGISLVLLQVLNIPASTAGGIINIVVSNLVLGVEKTNWPMMLVLGVVNAALYFVIFTVLIKKLKLHTPGREGNEDDASAVAAPDAAAPAAAVDTAGDDAILDLIKGLGGKENIQSVENCFTRLRVSVADESLVNEDFINRMENSGIVRKGNDVQIIFGMKVASVRGAVEDALEKM